MCIFWFLNQRFVKILEIRYKRLHATLLQCSERAKTAFDELKTALKNAALPAHPNTDAKSTWEGYNRSWMDNYSLCFSFRGNSQMQNNVILHMMETFYPCSLRLSIFISSWTDVSLQYKDHKPFQYTRSFHHRPDPIKTVSEMVHRLAHTNP